MAALIGIAIGIHTGLGGAGLRQPATVGRCSPDVAVPVLIREGGRGSVADDEVVILSGTVGRQHRGTGAVGKRSGNEGSDQFEHTFPGGIGRKGVQIRWRIPGIGKVRIQTVDRVDVGLIVKDLDARGDTDRHCHQNNGDNTGDSNRNSTDGGDAGSANYKCRTREGDGAYS